uniref:Secreted protein n=1 Tax=Echeneis naucrates TaxID=173247 RepID=A0A665UWY4_ECHNA
MNGNMKHFLVMKLRCFAAAMLSETQNTPPKSTHAELLILKRQTFLKWSSILTGDTRWETVGADEEQTPHSSRLKVPKYRGHRSP